MPAQPLTPAAGPWCENRRPLTLSEAGTDSPAAFPAIAAPPEDRERGPGGPLMEPNFHLFTYGTLTAGARASSELLADCERVGAATVRGTLYDAGRYPVLLLSGRERVEGEVWRCPAHVLPRLDRYEGVEEGLFRRVGLHVDDTPCWAYVAGPALGSRLTPDARIRSPRWNRNQ